MSNASISGYRRLLRSINFAFGGDVFAVAQAKKQLRSEYQRFRSVAAADVATLQQLHKDIDDVDELLRFHIVQGKKNMKGSFDVGFKEEHQVTIAAGQSEKHGPELAPIDPTYIGRDSAVVVDKATGRKKTPFQEVEI